MFKVQREDLHIIIAQPGFDIPSKMAVRQVLGYRK